MLLRSWGMCAIRSTHRLCYNKMNMLINFFFRIGLFFCEIVQHMISWVLFFFWLVDSLTLCIGINIFLISFEFIVWESPLKMRIRLNTHFSYVNGRIDWGSNKLKGHLFTAEVFWNITFAKMLHWRLTTHYQKVRSTYFFWSISNRVNKINRVLSFYSSQF